MKELIKRLEIGFRHIVVYPLFKLILRNPVTQDVVPLTSVKKMLILRNDGIGDIIVSTAMFRKLKELHPDMTLGVFASPRNADVIRHNPFVDQLFIAHRNLFELWNEIRRARREGFDIVVNFVFNRTTSEGLLANIVAPHGIKIGQGLDKYQIYFNRLLKLNRSEQHMVEVLASAVDMIFGTEVKSTELSVEVFVDAATHATVDGYLRAKGLHRRGRGSRSYMVINFSAVDTVRRMSISQTKHIVETVRRIGNDIPVLIYPPNEREKLKNILDMLPKDAALIYPEQGSATLLELASLIEGSRFVVTCDTSIVHFASAAKTPVLVLYTPTAALNHEWMPYNVRHACLFATRGLGVDSISEQSIREELERFQSQIL